MSQAERYAMRLRREWLLGLFGATVLVVLLTLATVWRPVGDLLFDHVQRWRGLEPHPDIVVVTIDDRSIAELGGWPLRRQHYAAFLEQVAPTPYLPRVVGMNLLLIDPQTDDARLALAMALHRVVLPVGLIDQPHIVQVAEPVDPIRAHATLGHIAVVFSADGSVRSVRTHDMGYTHLAWVMQRIGQGDTPTRIPATERELRLSLVNPTQPFATVSLVDVLEGRADLSLFKNKYVLMGVTSPTLGDRFATLYSGQYNNNTPGVLILASALQSALDDRFIEVGSVAWHAMLNVLGVWLVLLGVLWLRPVWALAASVAMMLTWVAMSVHVLIDWQLWLDPTPALGTVLVFLPLWAWRRTSVMASMVRQGAAALQRHDARDGPAPHTGVGEFVVQQARLLGQAVDAANNELDLLSSVIEELPEAVAIVSVQQGLLLQNQKLLQLLAQHPLEKGHRFQEVCGAIGMNAASLALNTSHMVQLSVGSATREFLLRASPIQLPRYGDLWVLVLSDVTQLRQVQAQRDQALQFLSHDMRTPLASILSLVRQSETPAYKIEQHAQKLLQMMDDFCMTVAADAPSYTLQPELLETLLDDALDRVRDLAEAKHVTLSHDNQAEAVFVQANAQLLVRALTNLLQNAVKFCPLHGTVEMRVERLWGAQPGEHAVQIQIVNRVEATPSDHTLPGFGLGLGFVQKVMDRHGGHMVRHIPPVGEARVTLELPCAADNLD